ncbi:hypothetical protein QBZ16_004549 [Prototheca wickerhamii]|uniref:RRM domain-containing protein n=1 Tax=Prototheca wickerhamii TaxID=3111 RepID=A0AAD9ML88_PROWI|nr:hypothetical protein QBZ16_004549 [Prototheca wickerhamii]
MISYNQPWQSRCTLALGGHAVDCPRPCPDGVMTPRRGGRRSRYSDSSDDEYGYVPRRRGRGPPDPTKTYEDPFAKLRSQAARAADPAEAARQMQAQQLRARLSVLQQQAASAGQAASRTRKENLQLYVGNLAAGAVSADMLRQLFETTMRAAFPDQADPVTAVNVHGEGRYAFVELRTPDMATAALQLNGAVTLVGATISVGRPSGYIDPAQAGAAAGTTALALARFQAETPELNEAGEGEPFLAIRGLLPGADAAGNAALLAARAIDYVRAVCEKLGPVLQVHVCDEGALLGEQNGAAEEAAEVTEAAAANEVEEAATVVPAGTTTEHPVTEADPASPAMQAAASATTKEPSDTINQAADPNSKAQLARRYSGAVLAQFLEHRAAERARAALLAAGGGALTVDFVQPRDWLLLVS